ncbi:hypothetical protein [Paenibacillus campi]|uniref:hypothetical protein n=1 Tax=Paenibacillus campi TaxID=3106031 RepID=UPI002B000C8C|nr:hypothetical protein [Paenibacillus sp. SGZ-1009]
MQWIILIGNEDFNLNVFRNLQHYGNNKLTILTKNRIVVDYGHDHIFYEYVEDLIKDYEPADLQRIPFQNPQFIMMIYTSEDLMRQIVSQGNFPKDIYIDDDRGCIVPIKDFIST